MKINKPLFVFWFLALISITSPIFMGKIPSMPRKGGNGWTPVIDMHTNPVRFWHYEASAATIWPILFSMYLLSTTPKENHRRGLLAFSLLLGFVSLAFILS